MRRIRMNMVAVALAAALTMTLGPSMALAGPDTDVGFRGWGPRVGLSLSPDMFHFGAHVDFGTFARHVRFQPNVELGFGNNVQLLAINSEATYRFSSQWNVWTPYLGGGLGANNMSVDRGGSKNSQTDLGVNLLGGIEKGLDNGDRFFLEAKFDLNGVPNVPDAKVTVGWTFYH
jgi:hypothetical protein